jgi:hypothetical protein
MDYAEIKDNFILNKLNLSLDYIDLDVPIFLSQHIKDFILGSTLGDLHISRRRDRPNVTANLVIRQSIIHKDYFYHILEVLEPFCTNTKPSRTIYKFKGSDKEYEVLHFNTKVSPIFNYYHDLFYINGIKVVPYGVEHLLTPRALAYWFKDDGTTDRSNGKVVGYILCTDNFSFSDCYYLCHVLEVKFNFKCSVFSSKGNPRIYIKVESRMNFRELIMPFMHPSMVYKLSNSNGTLE